MNLDRNKSLQELEDSDWGGPESYSPLESRCLQLRRIPLKDFEASDLSTMINNNIGSEYLIPMTLELLRVDPLADRWVYPGSLLRALLAASSKYWDKNPDLREEVEQMYNNVLLNESSDEDLTKDVIRDLKNAYLTFREFGHYKSLLWDNPTVKHTCNALALEILAVIASRQPVILEDLQALIGYSVSEEMIEYLLEIKLIRYDYEGPYPASRFFRLSKDFMKQLGLTKRKKG